MRACTFLVFAIIFVAVHSFSGHLNVIKPCLVRLATRRSAARTDTIDKPDAPSKPVASRKPLLLNTTSICHSQHQSWNEFYLQQTFDLSKQILDLEARRSKQIHDLEIRRKNILKMEYAEAAEVASRATIRFGVCRHCFSDRVG
jgi:hypothetical protein